MRKYYVKKNGVLPRTDFKEGDIVVQVKKHCKNIIILNSIEERQQADIWFNTVLTISGDCKYLRFTENEDGFVWHNGDILREPTIDECKMLIDALLGNRRVYEPEQSDHARTNH